MKQTLLVLLITVVGTAFCNAQYATLDPSTGNGYNGDVWLGFGSTSSSSVNNYTYELDLGPINNFLTVAPGASITNFGVTASSLLADLNLFYSTTGSGWTNTTTIGIFGGNSASNTYLVGSTNASKLSSAGSVANLGASEVLLNGSGNDSRAYGYSADGQSVSSPNANISLTGNAVTSYNLTSGSPGWAALQYGGPANTYNGNGLLAYRNWAQPLTYNGLQGLNINEILPSGVSQIIGTLTIGSNAGITYTAANVVPEPETMPLVLFAMIAVGLFVWKKKFSLEV